MAIMNSKITRRLAFAGSIMIIISLVLEFLIMALINRYGLGYAVTNIVRMLKGAIFFIAWIFIANYFYSIQKKRK